MIRQGDVLLIPDDDATIVDHHRVAPENGRLILARGEATGHHHSVSAVGAAFYRPDDAGSGGFVLKITADDIALEHQEHPSAPLSIGTYRVVRQCEMSAHHAQYVAD